MSDADAAEWDYVIVGSGAAGATLRPVWPKPEGGCSSSRPAVTRSEDRLREAKHRLATVLLVLRCGSERLSAAARGGLREQYCAQHHPDLSVRSGRLQQAS
jgi:hypothetical protein